MHKWCAGLEIGLQHNWVVWALEMRKKSARSTFLHSAMMRAPLQPKENIVIVDMGNSIFWGVAKYI